MGKTQLALAYAYAHQERYELIWLLRADDPAVLDGELRSLGAALRLPLPPDDPSAARQMVLSWLNGGDKRWLLLYDNVDKMTPRELRPYLPGGRGHVLITSRRPHWTQAATLTLGVFTEEEAAAFWRQRLVQSFGNSQDMPGRLNQSETDALAELAAEMGYLPLALEQAAAYMETKRKNAAAYLRLYRERRRELWAKEEPPDDYHATITTTWQMAFDELRQTPGAAALLNLICFLAPGRHPAGCINRPHRRPAGRTDGRDGRRIGAGQGAGRAASLLPRNPNRQRSDNSPAGADGCPRPDAARNSPHLGRDICNPAEHRLAV